MPRQHGGYSGPMTPMASVWSRIDNHSAQRQRLLPSAIEMTTPPQTVIRKNSGLSSETGLPMPPMPPVQTPQGQGTFSVQPTTVRSVSDPSISAQPGVKHNFRIPPFAKESYGSTPMHNMSGQHMVTRFQMHGKDHVDPNYGMSPSQGSMESPGYYSLGNKFSVPQPVHYYTTDEHPPNMNNQANLNHQVTMNHYWMNHPADMPRHLPFPPGYGVPSHYAPGIDTNPSFSRALHSNREIKDTEPAHTHKLGWAHRSLYEEYNHYILRHAAETKVKAIWPPEIEAIFMEALWLIPGEPVKIVMNSRVRGRNELISDYLKHKIGEERSRKQVSSHLQVLKKLLSHDQQFLDLVGPKKITKKAVQAEKSRAKITVGSIGQLIAKLKAAKRNHTKPQFLIQAEANSSEMQRSLSAHPVFESESTPSNISRGIVGPSGPINHHGIVGDNGSVIPHNNAGGNNVVRIPMGPMSVNTQPTDTSITKIPRVPSANQSLIDLNHPTGHHIPEHSVHRRVTQVKLEEPPMRHPVPVHIESKVEPVILPSASVPPEDPLSTESSPRNVVPQHHRRTTSASVDLSGDKVLPIQFRMFRQNDQSQFIYSRLLKAAYESPTRPLSMESLLGDFEELNKLNDSGSLAGVQIVHANVSLHVKPVGGTYNSDVQYVVTRGDSGAGHRYFTKTIVSSRKTELLKCEMPCMYQRLAGRGLEQDKEIVNVPFLTEFWSDFLGRLDGGSPDYIQAALGALKMYQAVYRVINETEELCFVSLFQFGAVQDEFSARTRFRRVKGIPHPASSQGTLVEEPTTPTRNRGHTRTFSQHLQAGATTESRNADAAPSISQTPKSLLTPAMLGIDTPGRTINSLGTMFGYESPGVFPSPRRLNGDTVEFGTSPMTAVLNAESRGSPRTSKFEIQRSMTAFEPLAWDEMQEWIYQ